LGAALSSAIGVGPSRTLLLDGIGRFALAPGADVAGLVALLASTNAGYVTARTINVDGGLIMA